MVVKNASKKLNINIEKLLEIRDWKGILVVCVVIHPTGDIMFYCTKILKCIKKIKVMSIRDRLLKMR